MECWAALSYCKRDIDRGPINPRQPKDFENFRLLEYRQELRACNLNEFYQYQCFEKESELCFEVLRNFHFGKLFYKSKSFTFLYCGQ